MTANRLDQDAELDLENRRRRLKFRAWHRGVKEADLILGQFVDAHAAAYGHEEIRWFEKLFEEADQDILNWIMKGDRAPEPFETPIMQQLRKLDFLNLQGSS